MMFTNEELNRYARHFAIPDFGQEGQAKLKAGRVLVIGAGGLGCPMLQYLAAAGVGKIGIVDFDRIDLSNLQRQILYGTDDIGQLKAEVAKRKLLALNPHIDIQTYTVALSRDNVLKLFSDYDIIADGTDNFPTRYLVNDACVLSGKVNVYASIFRFEGQVSVFNLPAADGKRGHNYRDLYPAPPPPDMIPNCAEGGVLGVLPGIIGSMQAVEVIKVLTGVGDPLSGRLLLFDAAAFTARVMKFPQDPSNQIRELVDYEIFCGTTMDGATPIPSVTAAQLADMLKDGHSFQLIDVREQSECDQEHLNGLLIPLGTLTSKLDLVAKDRPIVVHCQSGKRSIQACRTLMENGFHEVYNLTGGVNAWKRWKGK
ncbi:MAG: molybdopterin-synthase adenylyltransferase MoeB [Saprospiraceae bacterium]